MLPLTGLAQAKVFAEICSILVHHALGLRLSALIIICRVVKLAVQADVKRKPASAADLPKADSLSELDLPCAIETVHSFAVATSCTLRTFVTSFVPRLRAAGAPSSD
jgi:hypothetical protein